MGHNKIKVSAGNEITLNQAQELFDFLSNGELPDAVFIKRPPKLGYKKAGNIIWFLQEHMNIIPDRFEICVTCRNVYDADIEGFYDRN